MTNFRRHFHRLYWLSTGLMLSLLISASPLTKVAAQALFNPVPTINWQNTQLPDWNQVTFSNLPGIQQSGSFVAPPEVASQLKYDPSRTWTAGQAPDEYTKLGDFQDSFKLQNFNLQTIAAKTGLDLSGIGLNNFGAMKLQSLGSLTKAIPTLNEFPIKDVKPVLDLLGSQLASDFNPNQTIGQLLFQSPILGDLEFDKLPLEKYGIESIPGLDSASIGAFKDWQGVNINQIPGLSDVPFSQFPQLANPVGTDVGTFDVAFATPEQQRDRAVSGSDVEGFNVSCGEKCSHIELSGNAKILGKQWVSGKFQEVKGGHGTLAAVNGGKEPTGRHPFGDAFKVVVWDVSEPKGTMSQALFFRICIRSGLMDLGCTPYFIGPVPFMTYREMDSIFLGLVDSSSSSGVSTPTGATDNPGASTFGNPDYRKGGTRSSSSSSSTSNANSNLSFLQSNKADCQKQSSGVVLDAFSAALSNIEGNYDSVGPYVCDAVSHLRHRASNCGRGLGTKQFMSYRQDVRQQVLSKSGGKDFLAKVDGGAPISGQEMLIYFPPADQEALFDADARNLLVSAANQTDPNTGQLFSGERLVQRAAQMHFGGSSIPIDSGVSDAFGKLSVKSYGEKAANNYQQALTTLGC